MSPGRRRRGPSPSSAAALGLLAEATRILGGTLDLGRLMGRLTELAQVGVSADAAGVWLLEPSGTELILRGDVGFRRGEIVVRIAHAFGYDVFVWIMSRLGSFVLCYLPDNTIPNTHH